MKRWDRVLARIDATARASWDTLADAINYLDPDGLDLRTLPVRLEAEPGIEPQTLDAFLRHLTHHPGKENRGDALIDTVATISDGTVSRYN